MSEIFKVSCVNVESGNVRYINTQSSKIDINAAKIGRVLAEAKQIADTMAQNITEKAKADAEKIRDQANEEALAITVGAKKAGYETGYETGYKDGYEKAYSEVRRENEAVLNEIKSVVERLEKEKDRLFAENKNDAIELSFKIAEKVINQKLIIDEKSYLKIYEKAVKDLTAQKWVKISVSKQEVEFVTKNSDYLLSMIDGAERLEVEVLDSAPAGECIVETSEKIVDASVSTQIDLLRAAVQTA